MAKIGLHGRNDTHFGDKDYQIIADAKIEAMKMLSLTDASVFREIYSRRPDMDFIVRLYDDRFGVGSVPRATDFVVRMKPIILKLGNLGVTKFEIHNEPNHYQGIEGWGSKPEDARAFASWYDLVLPTLREIAPWGQFGFPGLAPNWPHQDMVWLSVCHEQVKDSDWLGCHAYWQGNHHTDLDWGERYRLYHSYFPEMPIEITEFGDSTPNLAPELMASRYVEFYTNLYKYPYVNSASSFIGTSPDPQWAPFVWAKESGEILPVVQAVGNIPREHGAHVQIFDIVEELPRHDTEIYETRPLDWITQIAIHHSAVSAKVGPRKIALYHISKWGWPGIGYHFVINRKGKIYQTNGLRTISYHAGNANPFSIGICLLGSFMRHQPTEAQLNSLVALITHLKGVKGTKIDAVYGHKELMGTACPGLTWDSWKKRLPLTTNLAT